ncbi:hypothetical protein FNV43_RR08984 [Rhamnella rubrinervis]|uniref:PHD-type domain-containing protein n=1 Tax=Rhamnella rubrinervis TaxID=2594499 RepID=A0A8K0H9L0_9ROSA|nr:hypothetical protein FNV43_RR08984 [Rhamnella rubrinervis]
MAYKLRNREEKKKYTGWSSTSSGTDSDDMSDDPDYSNLPPSRQPRYRNISTYNNCMRQFRDMEMAEAAHGGSSSRNSPRRRCPGRPPKRGTAAAAAERGDQGLQNRKPSAWKKKRPRRRKAPYSLIKRRTGPKHALTEKSKEKKTIFSWLIQLKIIEDSAEVWYMDRTYEKLMLSGKVTESGILCNCCRDVVTVWDFELHAHSNANRPYQYIVVANNGPSLLECQIHAWLISTELMGAGYNLIEPSKSAADDNDDACIFCADGGDLICCEQCPTTMHSSCMDLKRIPQGDWLCAYCVCSYCRQNVKKDHTSKCTLCDKQFHWYCYAHDELNLNSTCSKYCSQSCEEIYKKLERLVGVKNELDGGSSWTLLKKTDLSTTEPTKNFHHVVECNSKLSVAWNLLDECFLEIIDRHTGIDVVRNVVYSCGSNLSRINFKGFYTAILEKGNEIVSAATIRIHGAKLAEMSFVATQESYRGKGMLRKLLVAIESTLCYMNVENLVIPAAENVTEMWINKFQFSLLRRSLRKEIVGYNTLTFPTTVRLQKVLLEHGVEEMEIDDEVHNNNQNGIHLGKISTKKPIVNTGALGINEVEDNDQKGSLPETNSRKMPLFDLNYEPPLEQDEQ